MGDIMSKIKRGFTLIEVIVSIALLGILAVAFLPSISKYFQWLVDTKTNITQKAFEIQDEMETTIQEVIKAMSSGAIAPADYISLGITEKIDVKLFKDDFSSYTARQYPSAYKVEVSDGGNKKFATLVGDKRLPELPVPVIETVKRVFIKNGAESLSEHEYFNFPNLKILAKSNMTSNPQNSFNRYRSDWYISKPGFIIPIQDIDNIDEDNDFGRIYPAFPDDYIAVPIYSELGSDYSFISATERNISAELKNDIVSKYPGRHILYTITPFAKSLKKGGTSSLLPIYIYGPTVTANLALHLDASTINMSDKYNVSTNPNGAILLEGEDYYIRTWKNSRPSVEPAIMNSFNAIQTNKDYMPVLIKNNAPEGLFLGPEIPFQAVEDETEGKMNYSVWGRALGNKQSSISNMGIQNIDMGDNWSMFLVMRRAELPLAPTSGSVISGNGDKDWSLEWTDIDGNFNLQLNAQSNQVVLPTPIVSGEWLLIQATSKSTGLSLKAGSLKKDGTYNEVVNGAEPIDIDTENINIRFNGVEIAEILLYNSNMNSTDLDEIEEYLTNKYNP